MWAATRVCPSEYQHTVSPSDPNHAALSRLVNWLAPKADFRSVYIQHDDSGGHRLHALHTKPPSQPVLSIPHSRMLTLDIAKESTIGGDLTLLWKDTSAQTYVAAYVLTEMAKGEDSEWWPYLQSLPTSTSHIASAWSDEELEWLQGTSALETAREHQQEARKTYDQLRTLPSFTFTYESYAHARRLVCSRWFGYKTEDGSGSSALVPLLDLINHAEDENVLWEYDTSLQAFKLSTTTTATVSAHQPLHTSYGLKSNSELLASYGFVLEDNKWDDVEVAYEGVDEAGDVVEKSVFLSTDYDKSSQQFVESVRRLAVQDVRAELKDRAGRGEWKAGRRRSSAS